MVLMKFKRLQAHHYGLRTKSDQIRDEQQSESSSVAQKAAVLMFQKQQQQQQPQPLTPVKELKTPVKRTKVLSSSLSVRSLKSPENQPKSRFSIHSYATNKVININSHNKVTSSKVRSDHSKNDLHTPSKRASIHNIPQSLSSNLRDQNDSSPAAIAAAALVAKQNPKSMIAPKAPEAPAKASDSTSNKDQRPALSRKSSVISKKSSDVSDMARSPYSFVAPNSSHRNSSQFSFNGSLSSLLLNKLTLSKSNSSVVSPKDLSVKLGDALLDSEFNNTVSKEIIKEQLEEENQGFPTSLQPPSAGLGVIVTAPTPLIDESIESFPNKGQKVDESDSPVKDKEELQITKSDILAENKEELEVVESNTLTEPKGELQVNKSDTLVVNKEELHVAESDTTLEKKDETPVKMNSPVKNKKQQHPYMGLLESPVLPGLAFQKQATASGSDTNNNHPMFLANFTSLNFSNGSDISRISDPLSSYSRSRNPSSGINNLKKNEEFLYQSPLVSLKKNSIPDSVFSDLMSDDSNQVPQQLAPKRKPPPSLNFDLPSNSQFLQPPSSSEIKRLSLGSDFDVEGSPQLSQMSFNSSTEEFKQKKVRKPPPSGPSNPTTASVSLLTPSTEKRNSFLQLPETEPLYEGLNESQMTFDEELASLNDGSTLNESMTQLPQYPTFTQDEISHHHHPHLPINKRTRKLKKTARALFGRSTPTTPIQEPEQYYFGSSDRSNTNLNPATMSQTLILIPQQTVKLKTTMRKDKKKKEFNEDKPWKHHNDKNTISEIERKRYEGVWVANRDLCMDLNPKVVEHTEESLKAAQTAASQKLNTSQLMHGIIVREIFNRSRLPTETLKKIYNLVDRHEDGFLRKDEFLVGMWLIDQCLYGRKLPKQVDDEIWDSVHNTGVVGVNISIGKKKKK